MKPGLWVAGILLFLQLLLPVTAGAAVTNYVTPVFPVRDRQYWRQGSSLANFAALQKIVTASGLPATWLIHYDVLFDADITGGLKEAATPSGEIGLFLEVTRKLAEDSFVAYSWQKNPWSAADKLFLSGYDRGERRRLIDTAFTAFRKKFGYYPAVYGAWYVDVWSMDYIRTNYHADTLLGLADQYSTDGYQTWGQYFDAPYIVSQGSAIEPAKNASDSARVVKLQWAPREPLLSYGRNVESSNFSTQVNDYARGKQLGQAYFQKLVRSLTTEVPGPVSQIVIGVEAGELEDRYYPELVNQLQFLSDMSKAGKISVVTAGNFGQLYLHQFPDVSPPSVVGTSGSGESLWWYSGPDYRAGIGLKDGRVFIRDLRFFHSSPYRDNDQITKDTNSNLVRVVPAVIDDVALGNGLDLGPVKAASVSAGAAFLTVSGEGFNLTASAGGLLLPAGLAPELDTRGIAFATVAGGLLLTNPAAKTVKTDFCHDAYGNYAGRFPCIKKVISLIFSLLPDFVYSRLDGQTLLGFRTGFGSFWGVRFPKLYLGHLTFDYQVLNSFISLKKKLTPVYAWQGRQEYDIEKYAKVGTLWTKGGAYGQSELEKKPAGKLIYENGYYGIFSR